MKVSIDIGDGDFGKIAEWFAATDFSHLNEHQCLNVVENTLGFYGCGDYIVVVES